MREALRLAKKGTGKTFPNPMVGAVVVKGGRVVGRGFHQCAGLPHAEVEALLCAKGRARGATLYVNLEPCNHFGRTPPCADAIIRSGVSRVVCAVRDPNARVKGGGVAKLRRAGISVSVGALSAEAKKLNRQFLQFTALKRPFVAVKFAASLDGKLATRTGDSQWITNERARKFARNLRGAYQAILVGVNTVLKDNPHLGVRKKGLKDPLRIILDPHLQTPLGSKVFRDENVIVGALSRAPRAKKTLLEKKGVTVISFPGHSIPLRKLLAELGKRGIESVLVEGGGETLGGFLDERIADRVYAFYAPLLIGGKDAVVISGKGVPTIARALRLADPAVRVFGDTILISGNGLAVRS